MFLDTLVDRKDYFFRIERKKKERKKTVQWGWGGERNVTCSFKLRALIDVKVTPRRLLSAFSYSTHFFPLVSGSSSLSSSCYCSYPLFLFSLLLVFSPCFISSSEGWFALFRCVFGSSRHVTGPSTVPRISHCSSCHLTSSRRRGEGMLWFRELFQKEREILVIRNI